MAALSTIAEVRALGNLPASAKLEDEIIQPHLDAANRELTAWVGDYSGATDDKLADCKEAEQCITMAYLLPVLNTLYTNGATTIQKELGSIELMFHTPDDMEKVIEQWLERAKSRMAQYVNSGGTTKPMGWYAV